MKTIDFFVIIGGIMFGVFAGIVTLSVTGQDATEKETIMYCIEQPTACKTKYNYYKLENQK